MVTSDSDTPLEPWEERLDELNDGLLEAYAAGFAKALENHDIDAPVDPDVESLKNNRFIQESHYYYWDGRSKPLELWLKNSQIRDA